MSKPTENDLAPLKKAKSDRARGDDEQFHIVFDEALEAKLRQLDPEWMAAMDAYYESSGMCRWYA